MNHVVTEVPFYRDRTLIPGYYVGGKTGTAQIWDAKAGDWKYNLFNYSFVGYIGRQTGRPDVVVAVQIHEGTPSIARIGHLEMPVMSFELFRRIAQDAITTPDLVPEHRSDRRPPQTREGRLCHTGAVRAPDGRPFRSPSRGDGLRTRPPRDPRPASALTAEIWPDRRTAPADQRPADPRRRRRLPGSSCPGRCSWPCRASGRTAIASLPRPPGRGAAAPSWSTALPGEPRSTRSATSP